MLLLLLSCSDYALDTKPQPAEDPVDTAVTGNTDSPADTGTPPDSPPPDSPADTGTPPDTAPPEEVCNGLDDDGNGAVDEGSPDTDGDGTADCVDAEACDGVDNNGDGFVDEGFDADTDGIVDCEEQTHVVTLSLSADDVWEGWADGVSFGSVSGWSTVTDATFSMDSGNHVLAVRAYDAGAAIAGFLAVVTIDGAPFSLTGDGSWKVFDGAAAAGWTDVVFNDSAWVYGTPCDASQVATYWGVEPAALIGQGAVWLWPRDCTALGEGSFRLHLVLP